MASSNHLGLLKGARRDIYIILSGDSKTIGLVDAQEKEQNRDASAPETPSYKVGAQGITQSRQRRRQSQGGA
jgi:hypothetical protein